MKKVFLSENFGVIVVYVRVLKVVFICSFYRRGDIVGNEFCIDIERYDCDVVWFEFFYIC